jgi:hypothetical protein
MDYLTEEGQQYMDIVWMKYGKGRLQEWMDKSESTRSAVGNKMLERVTVCEVTIGSVGGNISKSVYCYANSRWLGFAASTANAILQRIQRHDPYLIKSSRTQIHESHLFSMLSPCTQV